jgi:hypothetical protein
MTRRVPNGGKVFHTARRQLEGIGEEGSKTLVHIHQVGQGRTQGRCGRAESKCLYSRTPREEGAWAQPFGHRETSEWPAAKPGNDSEWSGPPPSPSAPRTGPPYREEPPGPNAHLRRVTRPLNSCEGSPDPSIPAKGHPTPQFHLRRVTRPLNSTCEGSPDPSIPPAKGHPTPQFHLRRVTRPLNSTCEGSPDPSIPAKGHPTPQFLRRRGRQSLRKPAEAVRRSTGPPPNGPGPDCQAEAGILAAESALTGRPRSPDS